MERINRLGEFFVTFRDRNRVSQQKVASEMDVDHAHVSRIESGEHSSLKPRTALAAMEVLGVREGDRIEFLLCAAGYPQEEINKLLAYGKTVPASELGADFQQRFGRLFKLELKEPTSR